jgi:hypothetical protein
VEEKHRVHLASEIAVVVKLEARTQLWQGGFESIIPHKQHYTNVLKAYHDQVNPQR